MTETFAPGRRNLTTLAATSFLRGAHTTIYGVVWQPFVLSLGASMPTLGLLGSLGGMGGIVTTLVQPLGGWFADRWGRKPILLLSSAAIIGAYGLLALAGWLNLWTLLILGVVLLGGSALANPARNSLTAESVRAERHGTAFSLIMVASMLPGILAPALGGLLADHAGYVSVFPVGLALEAAAFVLIWIYLRETRSTGGDGLSGREALRALNRSAARLDGVLPRLCRRLVLLGNLDDAISL